MDTIINQVVYHIIPGFSRYSISETGIIYDNQYNIVVKTTTHNRGFQVVKLEKDSKSTIQCVYRLLAQTFLPKPPDADFVIQLDGDKKNSALSNLKWGTKKDSMKNVPRKKNNTSGFIGVSWLNGKWRASIQVNEVSKYLGCYDKPEDAARTYDKEAAKHGLTLNFS